jgi:hypothetical protein
MTHPLRPGALPELLEAAVGRGGRNGRGSSRLQVETSRLSRDIYCGSQQRTGLAYMYRRITTLLEKTPVERDSRH